MGKQFFCDLTMKQELSDSTNPSDEQLKQINGLKENGPLRKLGVDDVHVRKILIMGEEPTTKQSVHPEGLVAGKKVNVLSQIVKKLPGSPMMEGHRKDKIPWGRVFMAELVDGVKGVQGKMVRAYYYFLKGDARGDNIAREIDAGIRAEGSISYFFSKPKCSICGKEMTIYRFASGQSKCTHRLGETYDGVKCYWFPSSIDKIAEISDVFRGAYEKTRHELAASYSDEAVEGFELVGELLKEYKLEDGNAENNGSEGEGESPEKKDGEGNSQGSEEGNSLGNDNGKPPEGGDSGSEENGSGAPEGKETEGSDASDDGKGNQEEAGEAGNSEENGSETGEGEGGNEEENNATKNEESEKTGKEVNGTETKDGENETEPTEGEHGQKRSKKATPDGEEETTGENGEGKENAEGEGLAGKGAEGNGNESGNNSGGEGPVSGGNVEGREILPKLGNTGEEGAEKSHSEQGAKNAETQAGGGEEGTPKNKRGDLSAEVITSIESIYSEENLDSDELSDAFAFEFGENAVAYRDAYGEYAPKGKYLVCDRCAYWQDEKGGNRSSGDSCPKCWTGKLSVSSQKSVGSKKYECPTCSDVSEYAPFTGSKHTHKDGDGSHKHRVGDKMEGKHNHDNDGHGQHTHSFMKDGAKPAGGHLHKGDAVNGGHEHKVDGKTYSYVCENCEEEMFEHKLSDKIISAYCADCGGIGEYDLESGSDHECSECETALSLSENAVKVGSPVGAVKPAKSGSINNEFFEKESFKDLPAGTYNVEPKYDGVWFELHKKDGKASLFTSSGTDQSEKFPGILEEAKALKADNFIIVGEMLKFRGRQRLGHEEVTGYLQSKSEKFDDAKFRLKPFTAVVIDGKDISKLSLVERRKLLDANVKTGKQIQPTALTNVKHEVGDNKIIEAIEERSTREGAMIKNHLSVYSPLGGKTLYKFKNQFEVDCKVNEKEKKEGGGFIYTCESGAGAKRQTIGKTFPTSIDAKKGDIIRVSVDKVTKSKEGNFTWFAPKVLNLREDKKIPDPISTIEKISVQKGAGENANLAGNVIMLGDIVPRLKTMKRAYTLYLVGGLVENGKTTNDIDILTKEELTVEQKEEISVALGAHFSEAVDFIVDSEGPSGPSLEIHADMAPEENAAAWKHARSFVIQEHGWGKKKHWDIRFGAPKTPRMWGFTLFSEPMQGAGTRKVRAQEKNYHDPKWMSVNSKTIKVGEEGNPTKNLNAWMTIEDKGKYEFVTRKKGFLEVMLKGKKYNGRYLLREIAVGAMNGGKDRVKGKEDEVSFKTNKIWIFWKPKNQEASGPIQKLAIRAERGMLAYWETEEVDNYIMTLPDVPIED